MQPLLLLLAYAALELALFRSYGRLDLVALTLIVLALAFSIGGIRAHWPAKLEGDVRRGRPGPLLVVCGLIALQLAQLLFTPVETLFELDVRLGPFRAGAGVAAAVLFCYPLRLLPRWRFFALVAAYVWMGASLILASPRPNIDLWHFRQRACELLLRGENPYAADYPNIYAEERHIFGEFQPYAAQEMKEGRVLSYPYPPLTLVFDLPGYVAGDVRWSLLAAMTLAALLMRALARRLTPTATPSADSASSSEAGLIPICSWPRRAAVGPWPRTGPDGCERPRRGCWRRSNMACSGCPPCGPPAGAGRATWRSRSVSRF